MSKRAARPPSCPAATVLQDSSQSCQAAGYRPYSLRRLLTEQDGHHGIDVRTVEVEQIKGRHSSQGYRYYSDHFGSFATCG